MKLHIAHDDEGYYIADEDGMEALPKTFTTRFHAAEAIKAWQAEMAQDQHNANIIDGYNHDDLGESPD